MKKLLVLFLIALFALTMAGCDSGLTARADYIGLDAAKTVALEDAGVDASSVTFSTAELDRRLGITDGILRNLIVKRDPRHVAALNAQKAKKAEENNIDVEAIAVEAVEAPAAESAE